MSEGPALVLVADNPVVVLVWDPATGQGDSVLLEPGDYGLVCVQPRYLDYYSEYRNGTVQLVLKREQP